MKKLVQPVFLIPLSILAVVLAAYLARGWIRRSAVPDLATVFIAGNIQNKVDKEYTSLGRPFYILGMDNVKTSRKCDLYYAKHFTIKLSCGAMYTSYSNKVSSLSPGLDKRAAQLGDNLKNQGWMPGGTTIENLGTNISKGIDWTPDAAYLKNIGDSMCLIDFNTAFSKPKPPAINGFVSCSRQYQLF